MKNNKNNHKVSIIMGSQSDYSTMRYSEKVLKILKIKFETKIISAHRTPKRMFEYARTAEKNNISVMPHTAYFGPGFLATLQLASLMKKETYIERFYLDIDQEFYPNFKKALNGKYKLPSGPGLGIDLDYNKLSKYEI